MQLEKDFYTLKEVATMFGVTLPTVYDWMSRRGLAWVRIGARRRITRQALEAFVQPGNNAGAPVEYNPSDIRTPMPATA